MMYKNLVRINWFARALGYESIDPKLSSLVRVKNISLPPTHGATKVK